MKCISAVTIGKPIEAHMEHDEIIREIWKGIGR